MKQFAEGSIVKFNNLFKHIIHSVGRRSVFRVAFPDGGRAKLRFESSDGRRVMASLVAEADCSLPEYNGNCNLFHDLLTDSCPTFTSAECMKEYFSQARAEYVRKNNEATVSSLESTEAAHVRIAHRGKEIDPAWLSAKIKQRIVGQDEQVDEIVSSICSHAKKRHPRKPKVIMAVGPTGVGKTQVCRVIAELLQEKFGKEQVPFIIVKGNEMGEKYRISQLVGSPAGYVGHDEASIMEPIKNSEFAIILLDEFEKADPAIHTLVMDWMDNGRITFSRIEDGEVSAEYDCAASIFILTSNIPITDGVSASMRFELRYDEVEPAANFSVDDEFCRKIMVQHGFRPELVGRISKFVQFNALKKEDVNKIAILSFKAKLREYGFVVENISSELLTDIEAHGVSGKFGVRQLENAIDDAIGSQLPTLPEGEDEIHINVDGTLANLIIAEV